MEIKRPSLRIVILSLFLCSALTLGAQTEKGKVGVNVTQSAEIDALVRKGNLNTTSSSTSSSTTSSSTSSTEAGQADQTATETEGEEAKAAEHPRPRAHATEDDERIQRRVEVDYSMSDAIKGPKIMRGTRRVKGYRIQVYTGGNKGADRHKAQEAGQKVKQRFPSMPVYVHFYSPRWMCRCGDFHKQKEAQEFLKKIKALGFPRASIVRSTIMVNDRYTRPRVTETPIINETTENEEL